MPPLNPRQFAPTQPVTHYQSGGIGHCEGDETRSVVGMVPTSRMTAFREHLGEQKPNSRGVIEGIKHDIVSGQPIHEPLMLDYDPRQGRAQIGEGNHRLQAAIEAGASHVPVRVTKTKLATNEGAPLQHHGPFPGAEHDPGYVPPTFHPSYVGL